MAEFLTVESCLCLVGFSDFEAIKSYILLLSEQIFGHTLLPGVAGFYSSPENHNVVSLAKQPVTTID